ncbi:MAG TPA: MopE-related protein, partial [Chitinophagales bacterium]|nr:MopE-related protein [Chitinophagales bacterium]
INPNASESCNGIDDNCNGTADDGLVFVTYYVDLDNDGFGDLLDSGNSLCNNPGAGFAVNNLDCNDASFVINPSAPESCNGIDDNCNGSTDDGLIFITYYVDQDNDGFGDLLDNGTSLCNNPGTGYVTNNTDCNDGSSAINPLAAEICNGIDDNCNTIADDGLAFITYYADLDNDTYGDLTGAGISLCTDPGAGYVINNSDCNDANPAINPIALESCNGLDDNCNGSTDEGLIFITYYIDLDNDTYGSAFNAGISLCNNPGTGYSVNNTDCNDGNSLINPAAIESCNGVDDNCNLTIDDGLALVPFYEDTDNDSFGNADSTMNACAAPSGYVTDSTDCDDTNPEVFPGAPEILPNGIDDDCDGYIDEISVDIISPEVDEALLTVFPNPTDGVFTIYLQLSSEASLEATVKMRNLLGQLIYEGSAKLIKGKLSEALQLNKTDPAGTYLVEVVIGDQLYVAQIVYQK